MARDESNIANEVMLAASKQSTTLFKNVRGLFWSLDMQRKVAAGLQCKGSSDLIGFRKVKVTENMLGKEIAVFVALEIKTKTGGNGSPEQKQFIEFVKNAGGIAGVCRSDADAIKLLS